MSWTFNATSKIWKCSSYTDLQYAEINNFAEYGQPRSPYESGYDHGHVPDFGNIVIEMSHYEVMNIGYGKNITALDFPLVNHFLNNGVLMGDRAYVPQAVERAADAVRSTFGFIPTLPVGRYILDDLIRTGAVPDGDRFINTNLYGLGSYGITAGGISAGDAAYIHGSVSFALRTKGTIFVVTSKERRVEAEIGAGNDNWDFNSSTIYSGVNATVAVLLGPAHYNLTSHITILFSGMGKQMVASKQL